MTPHYIDRTTGKPIRAWRMSEALKEIPRPSEDTMKDFTTMLVRSPGRNIFELDMLVSFLYEMADAHAARMALASRPKATFGSSLL